MAEAQESNKVTKTKKQQQVPSDVFDEERLTRAMRARVGHFKEQANSLTLEGVRRLLERDLGLEEFALDANKRFIKQCLNECFSAANDENVSRSSGETEEEVAKSTKEETPDLSDKLQSHQEPKDLKDGVEMEGEEMEGSPVLGLLAEADTAANDTERTEGVPSAKAVSKDALKKAIIKRAPYFRTNSETITLAGARRLLEEDLKINKHALDPYKEFVKDQLDMVLQSSGPIEPANGVKNNKRKKASGGGSSDDEEVKPKKKIASKIRSQDSEKNKSRKVPAKEITKSSNKRKKPVESNSEESDDAQDGGNVSEGGSSQSSVEEPNKKKSEPSTQTYGKRVEHLKSVIRSCGMSVPPSVYKKAKQEPESKREACLIKELEEILRKEGLSTNPSEKEIKAVKKQKEKTKELEGIDLSNIVSSSRRRSNSSFVPPPPPKISVGSDEEDSDDEDNDDDDDDDDDEGEEDSEDGNEDVAVDGSSSEEDLNEDVEDESD